MTTISIFAPIKLGRRLLACERGSATSYILIADGVRSSMSVEDADTLGKRGWKIHQRWEKRAADGKMKPGVLFSVQTPETLDTVGISDDGFSIYVEADDERIPLTEGELQMFLFALRQLRDDLASLRRVSNGGEPYQGNVVPGLRGPGLELPDFAIDALWDEFGRRK
jgi:hypothetical protein